MERLRGLAVGGGAFAEYRNYGPGAVVTPDRPQLTDAEAGDYTPAAFLGDWSPMDARLGSSHLSAAQLAKRLNASGDRDPGSAT